MQLPTARTLAAYALRTKVSNGYLLTQEEMRFLEEVEEFFLKAFFRKAPVSTTRPPQQKTHTRVAPQVEVSG